MDFLVRNWQQVQAQLGKLNRSQKWLIMSLAVILALVLFLVALYTGEGDMVPITQFAGDRQSVIVAQLSKAGVDVKTRGTQILVPRSQLIESLSMLEQHDLMADDISGAFDALEEQRSPWDSNDARHQSYVIAKQKVLSKIVSRMEGVQNAAVLISMPKREGFGTTYQRPSASVSVWMRGNAQVDKHRVKAIAGLISGAVAEMKPQDVSITDSRGMQFSVDDENEILPTESIEMVEHLKRDYRDEIEHTLRFIPGVIVAVNVKVDHTRETKVVSVGYEKDQSVASESSTEENQATVQRSAEPGVGTNVHADIGAGGNAGTEMTRSTSDVTLLPKSVTERKDSVIVGHRPQEINVTVNVPRSFFVNYWKKLKPDGGEPDETALDPFITEQLAEIEEMVRPLIKADAAGSVKAHVIPDPTAMIAAASVPVQQGTVELIMTSNWTKPVGMGLLAATALALMFFMVRQSTRQPELPSVEELAGVPPTLPGEDELMGEVDEMDPTMAGIEVDEDELQARRVAEQIAEMVRASPSEAATLFGKWVGRDD